MNRATLPSDALRIRLRAPSMALGWTIAILIPVFFVTWFLVDVVYGVPFTEETFRFKHPWAALLFPAGVAVWAARSWLQAQQKPRLQMSRLADIARSGSGWKKWFQGCTTGLRVVTLALLVIALMRPQSVHARDSATIQGLDIMMALDLSGSMRVQDILPDRFTATQHVVDQFLGQRPNDRIGAVIFGAEAFTLLPLTTDKEALRSVVRELQLGAIDGEGTAIGNAVGVALNRLRSSTAVQQCVADLHAREGTNENPVSDTSENTSTPEGPPERTCGVIILATDGSSNSGNISPDQAAHFARVMGIKIFTILMGVADEANVQLGVGSTGRPILGRQQAPANPELLVNMANTTGGTYFGVSDRAQLETSFHRILNELERHDIEDRGKTYGEVFPAFAWMAVILLSLEILLATLFLRRWP